MRSSCCRTGAATEDRTIWSYDPGTNRSYGDNRVVNSRYTALTFLPWILFIHIRRFMYFFFVKIGFLQLWKDVAPVNPLTTWVPIMVIFAVTGVREAADDWHRHQHDKEINGRRFTVIRNGSETELEARAIRVSDLIVPGMGTIARRTSRSCFQATRTASAASRRRTSTARARRRSASPCARHRRLASAPSARRTFA